MDIEINNTTVKHSNPGLPGLPTFVLHSSESRFATVEMVNEYRLMVRSYHDTRTNYTCIASQPVLQRKQVTTDSHGVQIFAWIDVPTHIDKVEFKSEPPLRSAWAWLKHHVQRLFTQSAQSPSA